jgi:FixJ family two-component response regulator
MISIVDDDFFVREATRDLVQSLGYRAFTFSTAEQFLKSGRVDETECLITDLQMPGLSGLALQKLLRADGYETPIIFITGSTEERSRRRALDAGAVEVLSKPFDEKSLIRCLKRALKASMH